jgi:hypothetical protein
MAVHARHAQRCWEAVQRGQGGGAPQCSVEGGTSVGCVGEDHLQWGSTVHGREVTEGGMQLADAREQLRASQVEALKTRSELRAALKAVNVLVDEVRACNRRLQQLRQAAAWAPAAQDCRPMHHTALSGAAVHDAALSGDAGSSCGHGRVQRASADACGQSMQKMSLTELLHTEAEPHRAAVCRR